MHCVNECGMRWFLDEIYYIILHMPYEYQHNLDFVRQVHQSRWWRWGMDV